MQQTNAQKACFCRNGEHHAYVEVLSTKGEEGERFGSSTAVVAKYPYGDYDYFRDRDPLQTSYEWGEGNFQLSHRWMNEKPTQQPMVKRDER